MKKLSLFFMCLVVTVCLSAQENLLTNAGFEDYSSNMLFGTTFEDWSISAVLAAESTDLHEGDVALFVQENSRDNNKLSQEISAIGLEAGATYRLSIWYKVKTSKEGQDIRFESQWEGSRDDLSGHDASVLTSDYFTSAEWKEATVETTCPAGASRFYFQIAIAKGVQVLFDDFSFVKLDKEPVTEPYLEVTPTTFAALQTTINTPVDFTPLTVKYGNLTSPVSAEITGANSELFTLKRDTVREGEEQWVITYLPTAAGKHSGNLFIDNRNNPELSKMIRFSASAIAPNAKPTITVTPLTVPAFTAKVGEQSTYTLKVNSENCIDYVYAAVSHTKGTGFTLSTTMLVKNMESNLVVTFRPSVAGEYASTLTLSTMGGTSVMVNLQGTATAGEEEKPDYDTEFVWNQANPYKLLNEKFENVEHNKNITLTDWQNVVPKGNRAWWGYTHDGLGEEDEHCAKATTYIYQQPNPTEERGEMWLVTPALDYKNAEGKVFTFRVMGDFMAEGHDTQLELYYIDATPGLELYQEKLPVEMPVTPDMNGEWVDYHVDLTGLDIADVFFMAFRYDGQIGETNAVTYYIDDVSWGRTDLPVITADSVQVVMTAKPNTAISSGVITITAANLTEDIKVSITGPNASKFSVYPETLPTTGGEIAVAFESDQIGVHEAYIKLSSHGAVDKYISIAVLCQEQQNTVLENVEADNTMSIYKVFEKGTIYIMRNNDKYTIDGKILK